MLYVPFTLKRYRSDKRKGIKNVYTKCNEPTEIRMYKDGERIRIVSDTPTSAGCRILTHNAHGKPLKCKFNNKNWLDDKYGLQIRIDSDIVREWGVWNEKMNVFCKCTEKQARQLSKKNSNLKLSIATFEIAK